MLADRKVVGLSVGAYHMLALVKQFVQQESLKDQIVRYICKQLAAVDASQDSSESDKQKLEF